jgi:hypothetical protein
MRILYKTRYHIDIYLRMIFMLRIIKKTTINNNKIKKDEI